MTKTRGDTSNLGGGNIVSLIFFGGGHFRKYKVLVTGVKVISKKICWEQLVEGGEGCPDYFIYIFFYFFLEGVDELHLY